MNISDSRYKYIWGKDKLQCNVLVKAPFKKGIKRNVLIRLENGRLVVVPWRSLRRNKEFGLRGPRYINKAGAKCGVCPECNNTTYLDGGTPMCTFCGWSPFPEY